MGSSVSFSSNFEVCQSLRKVYEEMGVAYYDLLELCNNREYSFDHRFAEVTREKLVRASLLNSDGTVPPIVRESCLKLLKNKDELPSKPLHDMVILHDGTPTTKEYMLIIGKRFNELAKRSPDLFSLVSRIARDSYGNRETMSEETLNILKELRFFNEKGEMHEAIKAVIRSMHRENELKNPIAYEYSWNKPKTS